MIAINIDVKVNSVYLPYLNKPQFTQIYYGGSSSGKSYFLAQKIVLDNLRGCNWLVCRNVASTLRNSSFNEITKAISNMGLMKYYHITRAAMTITCTLNNRQILFVGLDDPEKVKSITPKDSVLHRIFIEEATEIKREAYKQLTKRLRGNSEFSKCVILAFNPILRSHWIYKEFFGKWEDNKTAYEDEKLCILKTTYKDNLFLTDDDRKQLEDETDLFYYNVYSLGNWGILGHLILKNWKVEDLSDRIPQFDNIRCGLDFGWVGETAMIKLHIDKKRKKIYIFDEVYCQYMTDDEILNKSREFFGNNYVTCDSAEPRMINFLANNGIKAVGAVKGPDSIIRSIRWLQGFEIIIDVNCVYTKEEIEKWHWLEDRNGNVLERPVDKEDHLISALRYACEDDIVQAEVTAGKYIK